MKLNTRECRTCKNHLDIINFNTDSKGGYSTQCKMCKSEYDRKYVAKNRDKKRQQRAKYYEENKEKISEYHSLWRKDNSESIKKKKSEYYLENRESILVKSRLFYKENKDKYLNTQKSWVAKNRDKVNLSSYKYWQNNKDKHRALMAKRRVAKLNASVDWANQELISAVYNRAFRFGLWLDTEYHVDHIIPLQHPLVCGLHNEFNLQILTATENLSKNNKFNPEDFEISFHNIKEVNMKNFADNTPPVDEAGGGLPPPKNPKDKPPTNP